VKHQSETTVTVRVAAPLYYGQIVMSNRNDSVFRPPSAHVPQESASIALAIFRFAMIFLRCASSGLVPPGFGTSPALAAIYAKFQIFCANHDPGGGFSQLPELAVHQNKSTRYVHYIQLWDPVKHYPLSRIVPLGGRSRHTPKIGSFFVDRPNQILQSWYTCTSTSSERGRFLSPSGFTASVRVPTTVSTYTVFLLVLGHNTFLTKL
jgi:hypothetical protein